ncbi:hypothetical protein CANCADRAFT_2165 [Tortispora caseinolytica NRRL Y-17796]|uniref:Folylpolyglutamate synthase n=1 Tax=Tortispora caseinolytica NRRL Y-17796 TaxID=767744 RepID=A0A1E4TFG1_9ASCO|nr:hypothetical protein CANCADRAFT_2165 [Tortispora caseinolytica NRRL Y-17796]
MSRRTYADAIQCLNGLQSNFAVLDAIRKSGTAMNVLAIPEMKEWVRRCGYRTEDFDKLNIIHVSGTKGKGSTCAFVESIIEQYRPQYVQRIGLYTSPHLKSVRERIAINGKPISEDKFTRYFFEVWDRLESSSSDISAFPSMGVGVKPVYFRYLTLLSFHAFLSENVDTAIYEVGVGGEYDSTNVIHMPTVCAITALAIDHVAVLGNTIDQIAWHKAGIMKPGVPVYTLNTQPAATLDVIRQRSNEIGSPLHVCPVNTSISEADLGIQGPAQIENASLAIEVCRAHLSKITHKQIESVPYEFRKGIASARWRGRCETLHKNGVTYYIDGAHTKESLEGACEWFKRQINSQSPKVLLFNQQSRDVSSLIKIICDKLGQDLDRVIFSTNVTFNSGTYHPELTSLNTSKSDVETLSVQKQLASLWTELGGRAQPVVASSIEEALLHKYS